MQTGLRDGETFSSSGYADTIGLVFGHSILEMDEPEHHAYRALDPAGVHAQGDGVVGSRASCGRSSTISSTSSRTAARPISCSELLFPFPVTVIAGMIGLPDEDLPEFHRKAVELITIITDIERGLDASLWLYDYFHDDHRRAAGRPA